MKVEYIAAGALLIAFIAAVAAPTPNYCPLKVGDLVFNTGVVKIITTNRLTKNCSVGILYEDGTTEVIEAWRVGKR